MAETDLTTWLPVHDAATQIGCSKRTVERLAAAKELEQGLRRQAGSAPIAVYNPEDVARIAKARHPDPPPFVLGTLPAGNGNGKGLTYPNGAAGLDPQKLSGDPIQQFFAVLLRILQSPPPPPPVNLAETVAETRLFLTLKEAAAICGLPVADLRYACESLELKARKTGRGGWRIHRASLEAFR